MLTYLMHLLTDKLTGEFSHSSGSQILTTLITHCELWVKHLLYATPGQNHCLSFNYRVGKKREINHSLC